MANASEAAAPSRVGAQVTIKRQKGVGDFTKSPSRETLAADMASSKAGRVVLVSQSHSLIFTGDGSSESRDFR
ncbi:hypothetical protein LY78DRAFT_655224 [Colletotrichum sublineola]|nr:hypothetical protein LY78DRAFT_655224 [Colletotrichum sublineola]